MNYFMRIQLTIWLILFGRFDYQSENYKNASIPNSNYVVYLPIVRNSISEIPPLSRWSHNPGQSLNISYQWENELLNPNHPWRSSFEAGVSDWGGLGTLVDLYYSSGSSNFISVVNDETQPVGFTYLYDVYGDGITDYVHVFGNLYWDSYWQLTTTQRRSTAAHEIGHLITLGHISKSEPAALMWEWFTLEELSNVYTPQPIDQALIHQVFP